MSSEVSRSVARDILDSLEQVIQEAQKNSKPLEVEPYRSRLFEFFVTADGAGLIASDAESAVGDDSDESDLSADGLCRSLARRWGLDMAARESVAQQSKIPADNLEQMRLLWSVMRMWMEWTYAWGRWHEFHSDDAD